LRCARSTAAAVAANVRVSSTSEALNITAINRIPIHGHQGQGSIADSTVRRLLMLQGAARPQRIVSLMSYPATAGASASPKARDAIKIRFSALSGAGAVAASASSSVLTPSGWVKLIARLGEIPDPTVPRGPSSAAIAVKPGAPLSTSGRHAGGNG
jgi:hypothetical protein